MWYHNSFTLKKHDLRVILSSCKMKYNIYSYISTIKTFDYFIEHMFNNNKNSNNNIFAKYKKIFNTVKIDINTQYIIYKTA